MFDDASALTLTLITVARDSQLHEQKVAQEQRVLALEQQLQRLVEKEQYDEAAEVQEEVMAKGIRAGGRAGRLLGGSGRHGLTVFLQQNMSPTHKLHVPFLLSPTPLPAPSRVCQPSPQHACRQTSCYLQCKRRTGVSHSSRLRSRCKEEAAGG